MASGHDRQLREPPLAPVHPILPDWPVPVPGASDDPGCSVTHLVDQGVSQAVSRVKNLGSQFDGAPPLRALNVSLVRLSCSLNDLDIYKKYI